MFKTGSLTDKVGAGSYGIILDSKKENKVIKVIATESGDYYDEPEFHVDVTDTFASVDFFRELYWCLDPKLSNCAVQASKVFCIQDPKHPCLDTITKKTQTFWGFEMDKASCNLVQILCFIAKNDFSWYYCPSENPWVIMFDMAHQLITCLEEMDRVAGMAHLDLKPGNVLYFKESNSLLLCDGGSSRFNVDTYKEDTITSILTTLLYRCPEMHAKKRFGKAADIWSVGCVLYELFSGRILFYADKDETLTSFYESKNVFLDPGKFGIIKLTDSLPFFNVITTIAGKEREKEEQEKEERESKRIRIDPKRIGTEETIVEYRMKYLRDLLPHRITIQHVILACLQLNPDHRPKIQQIKVIFDLIKKEIGF